MEQQDKYRIISIGKDDATYKDRSKYIGQEGTVEGHYKKPGKWCSTKMIFDNLEATALGYQYFYKVLLKKLNTRKIID